MNNFSKVRLPSEDIDAIIKAFQKEFGPKDRLWIFGSRADLAQRGGDIDLYIETISHDNAAIWNHKLQFLTDLQMHLGEQKIDIIVRSVTRAEDRLIDIEAKTKGIRLV